ncbi:hypothetical protein Tco_0792401 [Tanacetum coccineum]
MEECHKMLIDQVDWANSEGDQVRINVNRPLPLGGPPGYVTIQIEFFFNKDLEYLRFGNKGSMTVLSISKMKAARYPDFGLELLVPEQMRIEDVCTYDISAKKIVHRNCILVTLTDLILPPSTRGQFSSSFLVQTKRMLSTCCHSFGPELCDFDNGVVSIFNSGIVKASDAVGTCTKTRCLKNSRLQACSIRVCNTRFWTEKGRYMEQRVIMEIERRLRDKKDLVENRDACWLVGRRS